jgi:hypothetical protein
MEQETAESPSLGIKYWDAERRTNLLPLVAALEQLGMAVQDCHPGQSIPEFKKTFVEVRSRGDARAFMTVRNAIASFPGEAAWQIGIVGPGTYRLEWGGQGWPARRAIEALAEALGRMKL